MKSSKQLLILLLCCLLVRSTAQADSYGPMSQIQRTATNSVGATVTARVAATVTAVGRTDCLVSRCIGRKDPRSLDLSNADRRGRPLDAKSFQPQGRRAGKRTR